MPGSFDIPELVARLDAALRTAGTPARALQEKAYLKSSVEHYGSSVPATRRIAGSLVPRLDWWSVDEDFWLRRAALLALVAPLRQGGGDFERFGRYADATLGEKEFFIRKGIGWVLRDAGKKRRDLVFDWLAPRAHRASGVTLREAVKPLSEAQRAVVLAAR